MNSLMFLQGKSFSPLLQISDGGNDALSDSENSDDEQVKKLIQVASNLQEMVSETLSEKRSKASDQIMTSEVVDKSGRKKAPVKCLECKKTFTHPKFLKLHIEAAHEKPETEKNTQVLCPVCKARFTHPKYLKLHMEVHDNAETEALTCHICGRTFEKKFNLKKHITAHENDKEGRVWVPCPDCPRKFSDVGHLKIHAKRIHDKDMPFTLDQRTCEVCNKVFQNLDCVRAHRYRCHPVEFPSNRKRKPEPDEITSAAKQLKLQSQPTTCSICSKLFASADVLAEHIRQDHKDGVAGVCPRCDKIFLHGHLLSKHQVSHEVAENNSEYWDMEKEDRTCLSCRIEFQNTDELGRHECKVKPKECQLCKKRISRPSGMIEHLRRHENAEKKYICSICDLWQTPKHNMYVKHMAAHSSHPKPFQCPICKHRATTFFNHKNHMRCHDSRFEFICYVCGVSISNPTNVRGHMRQKHNIRNVKKPFECDKCDRTCLTIGGLEEHKKQHKNKGDIQCPLCTETFSNNRKWRLHRSQVHFGKVFKCEECGKEYPTQRELNAHLEMHERAKAFYECEICHVHYADLTQYTKHWYQHRTQICKCARCFANMTKVAFEGHKGKHLQTDTRVNKSCRLCGQMLETIEDVYRHCIEHHEMNEALAVTIPCSNPAEDSYRCDYNPWNRTCPVCGELFKVEEEWSMHMESHEFSRENPVKCMSCTGIFHSKDRFMRHVNNCMRSKRKAEQWGVNFSGQAGQFSSSMVVPDARAAKYNLRSVDKQPRQQGGAQQQHQQPVQDEGPIVKIVERDSAASTGNNVTEAPATETRAALKERSEGVVVVEDVLNANESAYPKENPAERPIMCVLCCHFFETLDGLLYHLLIYCEELNHLKCWRCYSDFYTEEDLKPHVKKLKDECTDVDSSLLELRPSLFSCQQCDKYFISESLSLLHNAQYHETGNYQCHKCPQEFMYRYELEKHVFDQHAADEGATNICVMCCEIFECLFDLQQHMSVHKLAPVEL